MVSITREVAALMPLGGPVPPFRFFEPTEAFWKIMNTYFRRPIIDVGAGRGHVTKALQARGFRALGIDCRTDDAEHPTVEANAVTFNYPANAVVLLCRPCHGTGFVEPTIERARECGVRTIIYVGFAARVRGDLGKYRSRFRRIVRHAGRDDEDLYVMAVSR